MSVTPSIPVPVQLPHPLRSSPKSIQARAAFVVYAVIMLASSYHLYRTPMYDMDSVQYMANALLMEEHDAVVVHRRVYEEVKRSVPQRAQEDLLGHRANAPQDQNESRQERAANSWRFAEFLPFFAIRPLYNQSLWLVSKTGVGLMRSAIVISVGSHFFLGILLFIWVREYVSAWFGVALSILLMTSPPLMVLGRETTADALATLVAFISLYLIFGDSRLTAGIALLLASIYFRTDFVVLVGPVLAACWWQKRLDLWKAAVLSFVAVGSVICINHFAGDYGLKMLYYRNFIGVPLAPGEMAAQFGFRDYFAAFRMGLTLAAGSFFLPFLLLGTIGTVSKRMRVLFAVTLTYVALHFVVLPNWQERWVALFYLSAGVCAATAVGVAEAKNLSRLA